MTFSFIHKTIDKFRLMDLFGKCFTVSFALHVIVVGVYLLITMPSFSSDNEEEVYDASRISFKDTEVDFIEMPASVIMGGSTNPAPVEKEEWIEGKGDKDKPDANNTDVNINKLSGDGTDEDGYMYAELSDHPPIPIIDFDLDDYFPKAARSANITRQTVVIEMQVNENGSIKSAKVTAGGIGYGFEEAAMKVTEKLRFRPGKIKGKAVKMHVKLPVLFKLED